MANEGSTKPTYSEPTCMDASYRIGYADGLKKNEAELLRVRGLLQRQWISVEERLPETITDFNESDWVLLYYSLGYTLVGYYCSGHAQQVAGWYGRMPDGTGSHFIAKPSHWQPIALPQSSACTCPKKLYDAGCSEPNESNCKLHSEAER